jgi:protein subunit release factor A
LSELETQFRELENYFSNPKTYGDAAEIIAVTRKHRELKETIRLITGEWERLSSEAERKRLEYEEAKQNLDSESAR